MSEETPSAKAGGHVPEAGIAGAAPSLVPAHHPPPRCCDADCSGSRSTCLKGDEVSGDVGS